MSTPHFRHGFVFLVSVLVVGSIASVTAASLILLGLTAERNSRALEEAHQVLEFTRSCTERALRSLRTNVLYQGDEIINFSTGRCRILPIGGSGNTDRRLCTEGTSDDTVKRLEVVVEQVMPVTRINLWREVPSFSLCP